MATMSIKAIFRDFWYIIFAELSSRYSKLHWDSIVENVEKMIGCGDPSNGYAEYVCPQCGNKKQVPFTCKSRFCTSCGKIYIDKWVEKTVRNIFDVPLLITEGGLTSNNQWVDITFLPYELLRKKWQYYLLTEIKAKLPKTRENARFIDNLFKRNDKGFYVNGEKKMTSAPRRCPLYRSVWPVQL